MNDTGHRRRGIRPTVGILCAFISAALIFISCSAQSQTFKRFKISVEGLSFEFETSLWEPVNLGLPNTIAEIGSFAQDGQLAMLCSLAVDPNLAEAINPGLMHQDSDSFLSGLLTSITDRDDIISAEVVKIERRWVKDFPVLFVELDVLNTAVDGFANNNPFTSNTSTIFGAFQGKLFAFTCLYYDYIFSDEQSKIYA